jgi:glycerophosphoryl diester phosphodiesterase
VKTALLLIWLLSCAWVRGQLPLPAHSHNDYAHARPLVEALEAGFGSIEVDVHLKNGNLLVGHDPADLSSQKTIEREYLEPLQKFVQKKGGHVFKEGQPLILLVDIKTEAMTTYRALEKVLENYKDLLTSFESEKGLQYRAIWVVISGNRPGELMLGQKQRLAAFDGRLEDFGKELPRDFMPLVSDNWTKHFTWTGLGDFPDDQRTKLNELVEKAHSEGRLIRFWGSPDLTAVWRVQREAGVDLINTDKVPELARFLGGK